MIYLGLDPVDDLAADGDGDVELDVRGLVVSAATQHVLVTERQNIFKANFNGTGKSIKIKKKSFF